jgi:hypothetical protein
MMSVRPVQFLKTSVIPPRSEFPLKLRYRNRQRFPTVDGIWPCSVLKLRFRNFRNVKFPMEGGMVPTSPAEERFRADTLPLCLRLQVTPGHWHKSLVAFHEASEAADCWLKLALNFSRASRSLAVSLLKGDAAAASQTEHGEGCSRCGKTSNRIAGNIDAHLP